MPRRMGDTRGAPATAIRDHQPQAGMPTGVTFPFGLFAWTIIDLMPGQPVTVRMAFPSAVPTPPQYWKVDPNTGVWTDVCQQISCFVVNVDTLELTITDGGAGDLDGTPNGAIVDPGGLGLGGGTADIKPPTINCELPDGMWHAADVALACKASDDGSGLADSSDASFLLSTSVPANTETANALTGSRLVCDLAGNCATAGPVAHNQVDENAPNIVISTPIDGGLYLLNAPVPAAYGCSDAGSGLATCSAPVPAGTNIPTNTVGSMTFSVQASDRVGNAAAAGKSYSVTFAACLLYDPQMAKKSGSAYPIKLQLCDAAGRNVSSPSILLHGKSVSQKSTNAVGPLDDSGNANPDFDFRYDASLGGYIFNLNTTGLRTGTYNLNFTAGSDPVVHTAPFAVR
jgi:hypothetical protein